jgi:hypothetical protein
VIAEERRRISVSVSVKESQGALGKPTMGFAGPIYQPLERRADKPHQELGFNPSRYSVPHISHEA